MNDLLFSLPENQDLWNALLQHDHFEAGHATFRHFPDGESYVRILSDVRQKKIGIIGSLNQPDEKAMMLYFFSKLVRQSGAKSVTLVAPYLGYMRQDKAFHPGEAVTSDLFAELLSQWFDRLITIDPHLHRHHQLSEIYSIPTLVLHAAPLVVSYLQSHIPKPVIVGPDEESKQWVSAIATKANCPFLVLKKERLGDRQVRVSVPDARKFKDHTPVLIDDIISTGRTMIETSRHLQEHGIPPPACIGIHGIFAGNAWQELQDTGVKTIITTNTIPHPTNALDVSGLLANSLY